MKYFTTENPLKFEYNGNKRDEPSWRDLFKDSTQTRFGTYYNATQSQAIKEITKLSYKGVKFNAAAIAELEQVCKNQPDLHIIKNDQKSVAPLVRVNPAKSLIKPVFKHTSVSKNIVHLVHRDEDFLDKNPPVYLSGSKEVKKTTGTNSTLEK